jgi:anti-sigma factor (TIGR02949 family)
MPSCREIDPLVTPYIDGEATASERALVDAHLAVCPVCRHKASAEAVTRDTLRQMCRPCAPDQLRARCLAAAAQPRLRSIGISRFSLTSMSIAAGVLIVGGVFMYALTRVSPSVLAAQLTLDHVACFAAHESRTPIATQAGEAQFAQRFGWQVDLPEISAADGLELVGVRRCFCAEGSAAHAMYRLHGRPLSLYVIPDVSRARAAADVFGHDAVIWSTERATYVLLGKESDAVMQELAFTLANRD